ncbi:hypothetical protein Q3G72_029646 [Acer saccharum]|nr:hypothetical protein Q3G72_029646 [Acer saccharum]
MSNQSDDSSNLSLEKMINDYKGDSSEVDLDQSDTTSGSSDHDEVSIAGPPTDVGVGELSSEEALKRQMERLEKRKGKRDATTSSTLSVVLIEVIDLPEPLIPAVEKSKKRARREEVSDDVVAKFLMDTCLYSDLSLMLKEVN